MSEEQADQKKPKKVDRRSITSKANAKKAGKVKLQKKAEENEAIIDEFEVETGEEDDESEQEVETDNDEEFESDDEMVVSEPKKLKKMKGNITKKKSDALATQLNELTESVKFLVSAHQKKKKKAKIVKKVVKKVVKKPKKKVIIRTVKAKESPKVSLDFSEVSRLAKN